MLSSSEIKQLLLGSLEELETERAQGLQAIRRRTKTVYTIALSVTIFLFLITYLAVRQEQITDQLQYLLTVFGVVYGLVSFTGVLIVQGLQHSNIKAFNQKMAPRIKQDVYQQVFKAWNPTITYEPTSFISPHIVKQSGLFNQGNVHKGDDYCIGSLTDGRIFEFSELRIEDRTITVQQGYENADTNSVELFKGLFCYLREATISPQLHAPVKIIPLDQSQNYKTKKALPKKSKTTSNQSYHPTILDADLAPIQAPEEAANQEEKKKALPLFDQLYTVNSKQSNARDLLPKDFCQQLNQMRVQLKKSFSISFVNNRAYLAIPNPLDFWIVNVKESLLDPTRIRYLVWNFQLAFEAIERLEKLSKSPTP